MSETHSKGDAVIINRIYLHYSMDNYFSLDLTEIFFSQAHQTSQDVLQEQSKGQLTLGFADHGGSDDDKLVVTDRCAAKGAAPLLVRVKSQQVFRWYLYP